jgi:hypothetical protein
MTNNLKIAFSAPLNEKDTEKQTYGCRANNPEICGNNGLMDYCAFVRDDGICMKPSRAWKKQYHKLQEQEATNNDAK